MDLQQLPDSWIRLFLSTLSTPLKLVLRQCNKALQQLVDSTSHLQLNLAVGYHAPAIPLCRDNLAVLNVPATLQQDSAVQLAEQITALGGLPSLLGLSCGILQPHLIAAAAVGSPKLTSLRLCSVGAYQTESPEYWQRYVQRMALLKEARSLRSLNIDNIAADTGLPAAQTLKQCGFVGALTQLRSLRLFRHCGVTYAPFEAAEANWTAAVAPLKHLTRLSLCGALAVPPAADGLQDLLELSCVFKRVSLGALTLGTAVTQDYQWLAKCSCLTQLQLDCYVSRLDMTAIASLKQLRSLTLCYSASEKIFASELRPLTACKQLSALQLDSFVLSPAADESSSTGSAASSPTAAAAAADADAARQAGGSGVAREQQQSQHQGSGSRLGPSWQLSSLQKLSVGNIGVAVFHDPISTLAPNLTELHDTVEPDVACKKWSPACVNPLIGLNNLQVLWLDITCLILHLTKSSTVAASLSSLRELHVEMVGYLDKPEVRESGGVWRLPGLEVLELYTNDYSSEDWADTYISAEDTLIWQQQSSLQQVVIRGSSRLGGFLEHDELLALLQDKLPKLRSMEFVDCIDLCEQQLQKLLHSRVVRSIFVKGRHGMSTGECHQAWRISQDAGVQLEFL